MPVLPNLALMDLPAVPTPIALVTLFASQAAAAPAALISLSVTRWSLGGRGVG